MTMQQQIRQMVIKAHMVSLQARKEACQGFSMNNDMQREAQLLQSQIEALEVGLVSDKVTVEAKAEIDSDLLAACKWLRDCMVKDSSIWIAIREHGGCNLWYGRFSEALRKANA